MSLCRKERRLGRSRTPAFPIGVAVLVLLLMVAPAGPAWAKHPGKPGNGSLVANVFHGKVPPDKITCVWKHGKPGKWVHAYVCTGSGGYRQALSTTSGGGLLRQGSEPPEPMAQNPGEFTCERKGSGKKPSNFACRYKHKHSGKQHEHTFKMSEMVIMFDPDASFVYAWPPHTQK